MFYRGVGRTPWKLVEISCRVGRGIRRPRYMRRGKSVRLNELPRDGEFGIPTDTEPRVPYYFSGTAQSGEVLNAQNVRNISLLRIRGIEPLSLRRSPPIAASLAGITGSLTRAARSALMLPAG